MNSILIFYIGCCLGSFAYCFSLDWVNQNINIRRRSTCDHCHTTLNLLDLMPIFSQLVTLFHCRYCRKATSIFYIVVEVSSGVIFLLTFSLFPDTHSLFIVLFTLTMLLMTFCDIHAMYIPDLLQFFLLALCLYYLVISSYTPSQQIILAICTFSSLIFLSTLRPNSIGGADIKLLTILSLCIPITEFPLFLFFSSSSALISLGLRWIYTQKFYRPIPFIPFIFIGFYLIYIV